MNKLCAAHDTWMQEKFSKTKVDESGQPKAYFSHIHNGQLCFGIKKDIAMEETKKFEKEMEEDYKATIDRDDAKDEVVDDIMHKADWQLKDKRIARIAIAKAFIARGEDFDNAMQNSALAKWFNWVWNDEP